MIRSSISFIKGGGGHIQKVHHTCSPVLVITGQGYQTVASTEAKPDRINKSLSFRAAYDSPIGQDSRPLVLLYSWLVAKARHMHKYGDFYLKNGYDVLHIKIDPTQLLLPSRAQKVVSQVVDFTQEPARRRQPILVHGFSVGGYLYGETLVKILEDPAVTANLGERIRGQILDSPVSFRGIPYGVSQAVTPIPALQAVIQATISAYLALMKNRTMKHYVRSQDTVEENAFRCPTMFLYSRADVIGAPGPIEEVMAGMTAAGTDVYSKCFEASRHVGHLQTYPVEYISMLTYFLKEIGLLSEPLRDRIQMVG